MSENEWRSIGVQQSLGWEHYMIHTPGIRKNIFLEMFYLKNDNSHNTKSSPWFHSMIKL